VEDPLRREVTFDNLRVRARVRARVSDPLGREETISNLKQANQG